MKQLRFLFGLIVSGQNVDGDNDEEIRAPSDSVPFFFLFLPLQLKAFLRANFIGHGSKCLFNKRLCRGMSDARFMEEMA